MAKKPTARSEFVLFNVVYEDGRQRRTARCRRAAGRLDGDDRRRPRSRRRIALLPDAAAGQ